MSSEIVYERTTGLGSGIPLGGLGAGCVELREDGRFHNWQIFNNYPWSGNRDDLPPENISEDSFFALRYKPRGEHPRVRLLYDDDKKQIGVSNWYNHALIYNYPFVRNIPRIRYEGRHPFANLEFTDPEAPLRIRQRAWTPFIPGDSKNSSLPLTFFEFTLENTGSTPCEASILFSLRNFAGYEQANEKLTLRHEVDRQADHRSIVMRATDIPAEARTAGTLAIAAWGGELSDLPAWTDGRGLTGFENAATPGMSQLFYPFRDEGSLPEGDATWSRSYERRSEATDKGIHLNRQHGWRWRGALCQKAELQPGEFCRFVFAMSWHFPNHYHYHDGRRLGHAYNHWFQNAAQVMDYGRKNYGRFEEKTRRFTEEFFKGTLAPEILLSLNAQLTTFPQAFWWTEDGAVAAWEGMACCQIIPNTHTIWSSFQPLLFFPDIYLKMKHDTTSFMQGEGSFQGGCSDFLYAQMDQRTSIKQGKKKDLGGWYEARYKELGYKPEDFQQFGKRNPYNFSFLNSADQLLRDYLWTGDRSLLDKLWPQVREAIRTGLGRDSNGDGLPDGPITSLTYDHWFPPMTNCLTGTMFLAGLACAAELARITGDTEFETQMRDRLKLGSESFEKLYWNGEYYDFAYDPIKDENDSGCLSDQVSGHLYPLLCGVGGFHSPENVKKALRAVVRHNLKPEEGLLNGTDPKGRTDWRYFARYSNRGEDEALAGQWVTPWTGTEFYVAATMFAEGLYEEGLAVVKNVHHRHAAMGMLYNHMECGEHYFRPMVAWAFLPAIQGLTYDAPNRTLRFVPRVSGDFESILLLPGIWGRISRNAAGTTTRITVAEGSLTLSRVVLSAPAGSGSREFDVTRDGYAVQSRVCAEECPDTLCIELLEPVELSGGVTLQIS